MQKWFCLIWFLAYIFLLYASNAKENDTKTIMTTLTEMKDTLTTSAQYFETSKGNVSEESYFYSMKRKLQESTTMLQIVVICSPIMIVLFVFFVWKTMRNRRHTNQAKLDRYRVGRNKQDPVEMQRLQLSDDDEVTVFDAHTANRDDHAL